VIGFVALNSAMTPLEELRHRYAKMASTSETILDLAMGHEGPLGLVEDT